MSDTVSMFICAVGGGFLLGTAAYYLRRAYDNFMWPGERALYERLLAGSDQYRADAAAGRDTLGKWYEI